MKKSHLPDSQAGDVYLPLHMQTISLSQIIHAVNDGNTKPFFDCYREFRAGFISWALHSFDCNEDEAKDAWQEVMICFFQNLREKKVAAISSPKTYLYAIGKNILLKEKRKRQRMVTLHEADSINGYHNPFAMRDDIEHNRIIVEENLSRLSEKEGKILKLYYIEEKSMKEISEVMGYKNADVAKKIKYEAFKKLAALVKESLRTLMLV